MLNPTPLSSAAKSIAAIGLDLSMLTRLRLGVPALRIVEFRDVRSAMQRIARGDINAVMVPASFSPAFIARLARGFASVPVVVIMVEASLNSVLEAGRAGASFVIDGRAIDVVAQLGRVLRPLASDDRFVTTGMAKTLALTPGDSTDAALLLRSIWEIAPRIGSAKELARRLGVSPSSLLSCAFRGDVPSPKAILQGVRLALAARFLESADVSVRAVSDRLDASSSQSMGRTVKQVSGLTPVQFRAKYDGAAALEAFVLAPLRARQDALAAFRLPMPNGARAGRSGVLAIAS